VGEEEAFVEWRIEAKYVPFLILDLFCLDFRYISPQSVAQQMTLTKGQQWQKCGLYLQKIKKPYKLFFLEAYFLKIKTAVLPLLRRVFFWRLGILGNIFSLISVFLMSFPLSKKLKFQKNISQNPKVLKKNSPYPRAIRVSPFVRSLFPYARFVVWGSFFLRGV